MIDNETTTAQPWISPMGGRYTDGAGLAGYLRALADALEDVGQIEETWVSLGLQPVSYETAPADRVAAVDAVTSALGLTASLVHMHDSVWHYATPHGMHAVNVYSRVDGPACTWVGSYGCTEQQAGNPEALCAAHLEALKEDVAAAERLLASVTDLPTFTAAELLGIAADADVIVAETAGEPKPREFCDRDGHTWREVTPSWVSFVVAGDTPGVLWRFDQANAEFGPLVEVVSQPSTEAVA